jgi:hypothetical protein
MKTFFTLLGIAGLALIVLTATNGMAQASPSSSPQTIAPVVVTSTFTPRQPGGQPIQPQQSWGMGMHGGMMGSGWDMMQGYAHSMWQSMSNFWNSMMNGMRHGMSGWGMMGTSWATPQAGR